MCIVGVGIACVAGGISVGEQESTPAQEYPAAAQARVGNDSQEGAGDEEMRRKQTKGVPWLPAWYEFVVTYELGTNKETSFYIMIIDKNLPNGFSPYRTKNLLKQRDKQQTYI